MISVLVPVYNAATTLAAALASIHRQSFTDWELVAVDDGSTDESTALLAAAAQRDARVRLLPLPHQGLVAALNHGLAACRGTWLARFDADDVMHRDRLARQHQAQFDGVLGCGVRSFPLHAAREGLARYETWLNGLLTHELIVRDLFVESPLAHPSVMMPLALLRDVGGYQDRGWPEDYDLWLRLWRHGARFAKLPDVLHYWRDHPARLSRGGGAYRAAAFRQCKFEHLRATWLANTATVTLWGAGDGGKAWSRLLTGAGYGVTRHIDIDPDKIGQRLRGAPVVAPEELAGGCGEPILVTIGVKGARELIRTRLTAYGYIETRDFVCLA